MSGNYLHLSELHAMNGFLKNAWDDVASFLIFIF